MKLKDYLTLSFTNITEFSVVIGVSKEAVRNYCKGRVPKKPILEKIYEHTDGTVQPNDFYDLSCFKKDESWR